MRVFTAESDSPDSTVGMCRFRVMLDDTSSSQIRRLRAHHSWVGSITHGSGRGKVHVSDVTVLDRQYFDAVTSSTQAGESEPETFRHYMSSLSHEEHKLVLESGLSLAVDVEYDDGQYSAYNEVYGVYGEGDTPFAAVRDFEQSFVEFYLIVDQTPDEALGKSALAFKARLRQFASLETDV